MKLSGNLYLDNKLIGFRFKDTATGWYVDLSVAEFNSLSEDKGMTFCLAQDYTDEVHISYDAVRVPDIALKPYEDMYMSNGEIEALKEKRFLKKIIGDRELSTISILSPQEADDLRAKTEDMYNKILRTRSVASYPVIDTRWYGEALSKGCIYFAIRLDDRYDDYNRVSTVSDLVEKALTKECGCYVSVSVKDKHWYNVYVYKNKSGKR